MTHIISRRPASRLCWLQEGEVTEMTVFSNLKAAEREGFRWLEYRPELQLHLVVRSFSRRDGLRQLALAYARLDSKQE